MRYFANVIGIHHSTVNCMVAGFNITRYPFEQSKDDKNEAGLSSRRTTKDNTHCSA